MQLELVPQIDYNDLAIQFLPQSHRTPRFIAWMQGMLGQIAWINSNFQKYSYGDLITELWDVGVTYGIGDKSCTYNGVFISLIALNVGNNPTSTSSAWYKIAPSYIGAQERSQYSSQKLIFEYALNRWFRTVYRDPTAFQDGTASTPFGIWYTPTSDIFITTKKVVGVTFYCGEDEAHSCWSGELDSGLFFSTEIEITGLDTSYEFIVWIPTTLATLLGLNYAVLVSKVVDLMNIVGVSYQVMTY